MSEIKENSTNELAKSIYAINKDSINKICSGQVVLNLATAVKELVENSIDAKATLVEVKLREQGLEQIEVVDNGSGVEEENFVGLTAKYHTSKIREFSDLTSVETFGFRGEALSSLCTLSDMTITTRHSSVEIGTKLVLDNRGNIIQKTPYPRQIGTTVIITNLFNNLPVRKKEFHKNIKKEFIKMCQILQSYCLVSTGVRIICTNQSAKGIKTTIMSTTGSLNILDNVTSLFGSKQRSELMRIESAVKRRNDDEGNPYSLDDFNDPDQSIQLTQEDVDKLNLSRFVIDGWISSCAHGSGRSSKDRQFFYINDRPCEPKLVMKLINEIYHRFNVSQYPFIYLNIKLERSDVDVNLTPDKRQLLVNNEKILLLAIKISLLKTFGDVPSTFKLQNLSKIFCIDKKPDNDEVNEDEEMINTLTQPNSTKFSQMLSQWKQTGNTASGGSRKTTVRNKRKADGEIEARTAKMVTIQKYLSQDVNKMIKSEVDHKEMAYVSDYDSSDDDDITKMEESVIINASTQNVNDTLGSMTENSKKELVDYKSDSEIPLSSDSGINEYNLENIPENIEEKYEVATTSGSFNVNDKLIKTEINSEPFQIDSESSSNDCQYDGTTYLTNRKSYQINTSINEIEQLLEKEHKSKVEYYESKKIDRLKFKSEINPTKNKTAEQELETEITKEMFQRMEIVGQFNLGFIIVKLENDLFIVDQHATDEKYNFEMLQKTVKLQNQKLVCAQHLNLTSLNEMILKDNLEIFLFNGFEFDIDETAEPTKQIKLTAIPMSQNWKFGKEDIDELIFMLQDSPSTICRPSRVRAMFASRACRKSVMIGTALKKSRMRQLIDHMGEIEQPWNCPHGRPTMRHLINLALLEDNAEAEC